MPRPNPLAGDEVPEGHPVVRLSEVRLRYRKTVALDGITLDLPAGCMVGMIGPDGVGKSSLLSLIAGARRIQEGYVEVLGGDMANASFRREVSPRIAYMPQGLGKNLYPTLSVYETVDFFGRLFGHGRAERARRIHELLQATGLAPFADRAAGKLSGGMRQKLSLCCALIHDPDLLILDEPTTGVDPLSRRQFWELIDHVRDNQPGMSVIVATAYMEEAAAFDWLVAMDAGRVLATGTPQELLAQSGETTLEDAFIALLPEEKRRGHTKVHLPPRTVGNGEVAIEAQNLTKRFGAFTAVDRVNFRIERGEIFGFLGSNGCGKTTTMKMLTGLLPVTEGEAWLFGNKVDANDLATRRRVGYMSQFFSLYTELTVRQNLVLHARLFSVPSDEIAERVAEAGKRFGLADVMDEHPDNLPLGLRQRLSLAAALIHRPDLLILDEPTSGVDPVARDSFWQLLIELSRRDQVTIFISTHFMNEAQRCDRISLMHAGRVLVSDTPAALVAKRGAASLEDAFISYLEEAAAEGKITEAAAVADEVPDVVPMTQPQAVRHTASRFSLRRLFSYALRESLELSRDPIRLTLALVGSVILMFIMGYGISMDVEDLKFAVLDRDQTSVSRDYALNIAGSRYFVERPPLSSYEELDQRMRAGELALAIELPPGFGRDVKRGRPVEIGVWIDGAMPQRAETVQGYVQGLHASWLAEQARRASSETSTESPAEIAIRYRYNPDVKSIVAMVPAVIPILLMLIPAMLGALSVVREKELGSIINFYVTPSTRLEFLLGKQIPYIIMSMVSYLLLTVLAVTVFGVPFTGSFAAQSLAALLYVTASTAMGLFISSFMRSQIAAIFGTAVLTIVPATTYSGLIDPVSSLEGAARWVGQLYPTTHFLTISRGTFSKGLGLDDLYAQLLALAAAGPVLLTLSVLALKKQEG